MKNLLAPAVAAGLITIAVLGVAAAATPVTPRPAQEKYKYTSMAGCNTKDCHGAETAKGSPGLNEYTIWKAQDPHAKAFTTLYKASSKAMGKAMNIPNVTTSPRCVNCHSKIVDAADVVEGSKWSVQSGVSCEVCHGPAEKWFKPHATPVESKWTHKMSVEVGMVDLRDPYDWAVKCASCHLQIDHDMIKAGHPRLHFELIEYNSRTGAHWKTEKHPSMEPGFDAKAWAIGQAVSLTEALRNLGRHLSGGADAELTEKARAQAASHMDILKLVVGFKAAEIPTDPAACEALAKEVNAQAKSLPPGDDALLSRLAVAEYPKDFSAARQQVLTIRALTKKAEAKAAIDKLAEVVHPKNEATFDINKFNAEYYEVKKLVFQQ